MHVRVLLRINVRPSGWAWFGRSLWPHQRNQAMEGMGGGGRYAERAWENTACTCSLIEMLIKITTILSLWTLTIIYCFFCLSFVCTCTCICTCSTNAQQWLEVIAVHHLKKLVYIDHGVGHQYLRVEFSSDSACYTFLIRNDKKCTLCATMLARKLSVLCRAC